MPVRKDKVISFRLSDKSTMVLQRLKFLDGKKNVRKNISEFLNKLIVEDYEARPKDDEGIEVSLLVDELNGFTKERDRIERSMKRVAQEISIIRQQ